MRVHQQAAFVLLNRPYSETSWITEIFSRQHGRLALIAKGARRLKSPLTGVLLPFQPLLLSWTGKGEVPTLTAAEIQAQEINLFDCELRGDALVCGFYCNELITYLLHRHDPHPNLFDQYREIILSLYQLGSAQSETQLGTILRQFEQVMIRESGYAVDFQLEANGKSKIEPRLHYQFLPGQGFSQCSKEQSNAVAGHIVLALTPASKSTPETLSAEDLSLSKHLMRAILRQTLGYKNINSRELFFPRSKHASFEHTSHNSIRG